MGQAKDTRALDQQFLYQNYNRFPVEFVKGENDILFDPEGKEYIDNLSGIAVMALGHGNQKLAQIAAEQIGTLQHVSNLFYNREQALLGQVLVESTFDSRAFFCSTGTEANEAALKIMRAHGTKVKPEKMKVITLKDSFHGRTFGSMALTGQEKIQKGFGDMLSGVVHVEANNISELEEAFDENVCGLMMESLQGEGGLSLLDEDFVLKARELCTRYDALFCVDEIQSGIGRTGKLFHYMYYSGLIPDLVTMAKGLGGGFPIGAILVSKKYEDVLQYGMHGTTFGGNFLSCRLARYVLETVNNPSFLTTVEKKGELYEERLSQMVEKFEVATKVKGRGLMRGLVLSEKINAREFAISLLEKGLVVGVAGGNTLRFVPPLTIQMKNIEKTMNLLEDALKESAQ